jgi:NADH-quinone oxidoreductase subunit J
MSADPDRRLLPGVAALALFALLALVSLGSSFAGAAGFPADASVTEGIGYTMIGLAGSAIPAENFLAAFFIIALVLDAALEGSVLLAQRGDERGDPLEGGEQ